MPKPKPFSRPSIDLGAEKKEWKLIEVQYARVGDLVAAEGLIQSMVEVDDYYHVHLASGAAWIMNPDDLIKVFVEASRG